jgi:hypothetical protein
VIRRQTQVVWYKWDGTGWKIVAEGPSAISVGASGQIPFPATQIPSSEPNTPDDYEEDTFTPSLQFSGASSGISYSTQSGTYIKIGRAVHIRGRINLSAEGSSTGIAEIAGLPFTSDAERSTIVFGRFSNMSGIVGHVHAQFISNTVASLYHGPSTGSVTLSEASFTNSTNLVFAVRRVKGGHSHGAPPRPGR